jgi:hypothetical protein
VQLIFEALQEWLTREPRLDDPSKGHENRANSVVHKSTDPASALSRKTAIGAIAERLMKPIRGEILLKQNPADPALPKPPS